MTFRSEYATWRAELDGERQFNALPLVLAGAGLLIIAAFFASRLVA